MFHSPRPVCTVGKVETRKPDLRARIANCPLTTLCWKALIPSNWHASWESMDLVKASSVADFWHLLTDD